MGVYFYWTIQNGKQSFSSNSSPSDSKSSPSDSKSSKLNPSRRQSLRTVKLAIWNVHSAADDMTLAQYAKLALEMGIASLAIQETKRARVDLEDWTFAGDTLRGGGISEWV